MDNLLNKIHCMDCLQGMSLIPDKSIDAVICDLPYGVTARNRWDVVISFESLWEQYERIIKDDGVIILTAVFEFAARLVETARVPFRYDLIWKKNKSTGFLNAKKMPLRQHELILVFYKKLPNYNPQKTAGHKPVNSYTKHTSDGTNYGNTKIGIGGGGSTERYPTSIIDIPVVNNDSAERVHPTQKPVQLLEWLIRSYTQPGAVILDNAMGSGTTAEATINVGEGRSFIGFEIDENYCRLAMERIRKIS